MARTAKLETAEPEIVTVGSVNELKVEVPQSFGDLVKNIKDEFKSLGTISVKPYVDSKVKNMGLENYNMSLFPYTKHKESLAAIEVNGIVKYITGLDEFSPEVQNIQDPIEKKATIMNIRSIVAYLEQTLATNIVSPDDPEFWNKVKKIRPDNKELWDSVYMECGNEPVFLEPAKDPNDLIKIIAIEAGGFDMIAKSYEDAMSRAVRPKFYLDKEVKTISTKAVTKKIKNKALALLEKVSTNTQKMLYLVKVLDSNSARYKNNTSPDVLYDILTDYIEGRGVESDIVKASERFTETANIDLETLKIRAMVKDAIFFRIIILRPDGMMYHAKTNRMLGRSVTDIVIYLKNPLNVDDEKMLMEEVNNYWK